uniref:Permease n=1 Tax=Desulfobacca acetoxidans TaxID=60893 RepID=A0A7C5AKB6_9BACT
MSDNPPKVITATPVVKESYWLTAWKTGRGWLVGREGKIFLLFAGIFLFAYYLPFGNSKVQEAILEAFLMLQAYARNHTLTCVVPALFIAGAIITFLSQASVMRYLGPTANKFLAYSVASVSGTILAVCSCSVLPMFAGIYKMGAGLGPASAFLYSGPAINILAIFLTARVLGFELGLARVVGAVGFAFLVGIAMAFIFRKEEKAKVAAAMALPPPEAPRRPFWQTTVFFFSLVLFLIFAAWVTPRDVTLHLNDGRQVKAVVLEERFHDMIFQLAQDFDGKKKDDQLIVTKERILRLERQPSLALTIAQVHFYVAGAFLLVILLMLWRWFTVPEIHEWLQHTWEFTKLLAPLLYGGVLAVGFVSALIPPHYVASLVGDNSLFSNFSAALIGAFWYFATLTEVPITQALIKMGMAKGPALALLLAGPALSLPNMIVIGRVMGWKKATVFVSLVVILATFVGLGFGWLVR